MLKNNNSLRNLNVEFVSYTGKWPCLCNGVLTMKIFGRTYIFGNSFLDEKSDILPKFWYSGGGCGFTNNYSESYVNKDQWIIDTDNLPEELKPYATEIDVVFNENVPHGCCGGCL